ncbi:SDR family oxidoreductase [Rhodovibrionaceae bacterium A322]
MFKDDLLAGKRILVTGGGSGLGLAMGTRYLELGADLMICGRREAVLKEAAEGLNQRFPGKVTYRACDIRDPNQVQEMVDGFWQDGGIDVLMNNAAGNFLARTETLSHRAVDTVLNIVLHGTSYVTMAVGKKWLEAGQAGNVISIVTTYAWTGSAFVVPSAMAKAGVLAMTRSLASEWGPRGIRLNAIAPGPFPTEGAWERLMPNKDIQKAFEERIPLRRVGEHDELANLAAYLAADGSGYINGEVVTIDGGEWIGGAGEFNPMHKLDEATWEAMAKRGR